MTRKVDEAILLAADKNDYMNTMQLSFFDNRLRQLRQQTLDEIKTLQSDIRQYRVSDTSDRATLEEETTLNIRIVDRKRRLIPKIDAALDRIHRGEYGYCLASGEPIGIPRLLIRPTAEFSADIKILNEERETHHDTK